MKSVVISVLAVVGFCACNGGLFGECGNVVKAEVVSPSGRYRATVFERNCGATTGYSTHVSLREAREPFDPSKQKRVLTVAGQPTVGLEWNGERALTVVLSGGKTFTKLETWRDVRIVYR